MRSTYIVSLSAFFLGFASSVPAADVDDANLGEITVTGTREKTLKAETPATVDSVDAEEIKDTQPAHPSEIMNRIPGVHVNVTNGEGHMTAIRQPISTSPVYLFLEDGIPTRSTGFFNHNALYEVNLPQADRIEVFKGPGTALYGSDAIGGTINVLTRPSPEQAEAELNLEAGGHGWERMLFTGGNTIDNDGFRSDLNLTHTDGWRDATNYDRKSGTLRWDSAMESGATLKTLLSLSDIDQQTAGSSRLNENDYLNNPTTNYTPISYRLVDAVRLSTAYETETADSLFSITPYFRNNSMEYMPNWSFTYDPKISTTANQSYGVMLKYRKDFDALRTRMVVGSDFDYSPGSKLEKSIDATQTGNIYDSYTVTSTIYDYDVAYKGIAPYVHLESSPSKRLRISGGLRFDYITYDYDNKMADGPLVIWPTSTSFPLTYEHPSDTTVQFSHLSPKLGATYAFRDSLNGFASYRHAFRAPSESQLFRPGKATNTVNLKPVKVDSFEIGLRGNPSKHYRYQASLYHMTKTDDILTYRYPDNTTEVMNAGQTLHRGIEIGLGVQPRKRVGLDVSFSYAIHTYEDWQPNATTDYSGNEMEYAPRLMANTRLSYRPVSLKGGRMELEWVRLGDYWMDQANTYKYPGHDVFNYRINYLFAKKWEVYGRLMNIADARYATAASYRSSGAEYAPGMPRTIYAGFKYNIL